MRSVRFLSGAALAAVLATSAAAQPSATAPASSEKADLARQIIEVQGGMKQLDSVLDTTFKGAAAAVSANLPPEQKRLQSAITEKMVARIRGMEPQMLDIMVKVYADNLTDKELRDALAYAQSETGQSMARKLPLLTAQTMQLMIPMMVSSLQGMRRDIVDTACEEAHCTADDKAKVAAAIDKAFGKQPG